MTINQRISTFIISVLATLVLLRLFLIVSPSANLYIFSYNIHHLFIGAFLIIILLVLFIFNIINKFTLIFAGISSALVLDEIVYLIATDGSDAEYLSSVSAWGAIILTLIILIFTIVLYNLNKSKSKNGKNN